MPTGISNSLQDRSPAAPDVEETGAGLKAEVIEDVLMLVLLSALE
jgi:hypothetical protein